MSNLDNAAAVAKALKNILDAIAGQSPVISDSGMVQVWLDSNFIKQGYDALGQAGNELQPGADLESKPATKTKARELKLYNGRGYVCRKPGDPRWAEWKSTTPPHCYIAAYSLADALRVIEEYTGHKPPASELRTYWHSGGWGKHMEGVPPERGLWVAFDPKKPVKVTV